MKTGNDSTISNPRVLLAGNLFLLLMFVRAINVVAAPTSVTIFPISSSSAGQSTDEPFLDGIYSDVIEALLPVAILCATSLLCIAVWLLVVGAYLRSRGGHSM
jgi:hypothetical protein